MPESMSESFCPRLADAATLLPSLRAHIALAASRHPLPGPLALDLVPIVHAGLFGYELVADREIGAYPTIGCDFRGVATVRMTSYGAEPPSALRLAAIDGRPVAHASHRPERPRLHDEHHPDLPSAAAAAWTRLALRLGDRPRVPAQLNASIHGYLDEALRVAQAHLALWNPHIHFHGLPNEAQQGFDLRGGAGEHGKLVAQRPDIWILRWKTPVRAICEEWSVALPQDDAATRLTRA